MLRKRQSEGNSLLVEFLLITFSILLAFMLNSWNEKRKSNKKCNLFLEGIYEEIDANIKAVEKTLPYHKRLLKTLYENPAEANMVLKPAAIRNAAWRLASTDDFKNHIDKDLYYELVNAYEVHDYLNSHSMNAGEIMMELNLFSPYYMVGIEKEYKESDYQYFRTERRKSWIPIFQEWCAVEQQYLNTLINLKSQRDEK